MAFDLDSALDMAREKRPPEPERDTLKTLFRQNFDAIHKARAAGDRWEDIAEVWSGGIGRSVSPKTLAQYYSELSGSKKSTRKSTKKKLGSNKISTVSKSVPISKVPPTFERIVQASDQTVDTRATAV